MYKVGDRVEIVNDRFYPHRIGSIALVVGVSESSRAMWVFVDDVEWGNFYTFDEVRKVTWWDRFFRYCRSSMSL